MNPAPSIYSIYYLYLSKNQKHNEIIKGLKKTESEEGAG
jgi:hypothetical protein